MAGIKRGHRVSDASRLGDAAASRTDGRGGSLVHVPSAETASRNSTPEAILPPAKSLEQQAADAAAGR